MKSAIVNCLSCGVPGQVVFTNEGKIHNELFPCKCPRPSIEEANSTLKTNEPNTPMEIVTQKYVRKPLYVDAVKITMENLVDIAHWCQGEIKNYDDKILSAADAENPLIERYIHVRVHNPKNVRQTKGFIGDWLLYTERGYKIYTQKAFRSSFDFVDETAEEKVRGEISRVERAIAEKERLEG